MKQENPFRTNPALNEQSRLYAKRLVEIHAVSLIENLQTQIQEPEYLHAIQSIFDSFSKQENYQASLRFYVILTKLVGDAVPVSISLLTSMPHLIPVVMDEFLRRFSALNAHYEHEYLCSHLKFDFDADDPANYEDEAS